MDKEISQTTTSILTLLNNIDELIIKSSRRTDAGEVMRALVSYANAKNYPLPTEKIDNFNAILLDARIQTLSFLVKDMAGDIMKEGMNKS